MSDNKKYYYLKLVDNFYERDEMIMLESMPDGYMYSNVLLKLYLRSLKNEGKLLFNDRIPYNSTMLSSVTRLPVAVVEKALTIFRELGLIEVLDNGAIYMLDIQNFIGQSSTEADRKRDYRKRIEEEKAKIGQMSGQLSLDCPAKCPNGQMSGQTSDKTPPEIEKDIEKDIEKEKDIHIYIEKEDVGMYVDIPKNTLKEFSVLYEKNIGLINGITAEWLIEISETIDIKLFKRAIEIATDRNKCSPGYVKGILKQWIDRNITTFEQLEAYKLQEKQNSQKDVNSNDRSRERANENESRETDTESEEYRRLLEECDRLARED